MAWAGEAVPPNTEELHELRQAVEEQQARQIEKLTEQVGRLTRLIEAQKGTEAPAKPAEAAGPSPATTSVETTKSPAEAAPTEAPKAEVVPKTEAVADGAKHVVAKGETLTSIAKHYNIAVTDLKNANKIGDERKLQIGQILTVPTAKPSDSSDKKEKENP